MNPGLIKLKELRRSIDGYSNRNETPEHDACELGQPTIQSVEPRTERIKRILFESTKNVWFEDTAGKYWIFERNLDRTFQVILKSRTTGFEYGIQRNSRIPMGFVTKKSSKEHASKNGHPVATKSTGETPVLSEPEI